MYKYLILLLFISSFAYSSQDESPYSRLEWELGRHSIFYFNQEGEVKIRPTELSIEVLEENKVLLDKFVENALQFENIIEISNTKFSNIVDMQKKLDQVIVRLRAGKLVRKFNDEDICHDVSSLSLHELKNVIGETYETISFLNTNALVVQEHIGADKSLEINNYLKLCLITLEDEFLDFLKDARLAH